MKTRFAAVVALCAMMHVAGYSGEGTTAASFLKVQPGGRPEAMGGAFCAVANDVNAIDYNTAGLAQLSDRIQVMLSHNEWIEGVRSEYLGFVLPVGEVSSLGMSLHYFYVDGLIERDILGDESGRTFGAKDGAVTTAFGTRIAENVSVGGSVKVISESVYDKSSIAASADLGCLVSFDRFSVGAALQNIGTPLQLADDSFPLPFRARAGASYACSDNLLVAADLCQNFPGRSEVKAGAEYSLGQMVFLRAGYRFNQYENTGPGVSAGLGLQYSGYQFDYCFLPFGDFGATHRLSLSITLNDPLACTRVRYFLHDLFKALSSPGYFR